MYKYKCTSRYKMLLWIDGSVVEILPQRIIEFPIQIQNKFLKRIYNKKPVIKKQVSSKKTKISTQADIQVKEIKMEKNDGSL